MSYCADHLTQSRHTPHLVLKWSAIGDVIIATALFEISFGRFQIREFISTPAPGRNSLRKIRGFNKFSRWLRDRRRTISKM
ncbi:MAG: hypothetical protein R3F44_01350 [Candidatus Competibacteraceae bacterium]